MTDGIGFFTESTPEKCYGMTIFAEKHCALASSLHFSMKGYRLSKHLRLSWDASVASEFYNCIFA